MSLKIEQVHKYFVGEVSGIDLSDPLSKSEVTQIEEGMDRFGVLIFREQFLSDEEQVSYTKNFGELELHVGSNVLKGNERPSVTYANRKGKYMKQKGVTLPKI